MGPRGAVPVDELGQVCSWGAHAVIGAQVHTLELDRTPEALDEHVVASRALAVHG